MSDNEQQQTNAGQPGQQTQKQAAQQQTHVGQVVQYTETVGERTRTYAGIVTHVNTDNSVSLSIVQPEGGMRTVQNVAFSQEAKHGAFNRVPERT